MSVEDIIKQMELEYDHLEDEVVRLMERAAQCLNTLKEIASNLNHISHLFNSSLYLFPTIFIFFNGLPEYIVCSIQTVPIPWNSLFQSPKTYFNLTLHYSPHCISCRKCIFELLLRDN
ncbi:unnamed protein product [Boreogadus saida]